MLIKTREIRILVAVVFTMLLTFFQKACLNDNVNHSSLDVANGDIAPINHPSRLHTVRLEIVKGNDRDRNFLCTGTLITAKHILTASHCIFGVDQVTAIFEKNQWKETAGNVRIKALRFTHHPAFEIVEEDEYLKEIRNDIAIVELEQTAPAHFTPVRIGTKDDIMVGQEVILAGYGQPNGFQAPDKKLRVAKTHIAALRNQDPKPDLNGQTDIIIDTYARNDNSLSCQGDSGGPMYVEGLTGDLFIIGITSYGDEYCEFYSDYVSLLPFWSWVEGEIYTTRDRLSLTSVKTAQTSEEFQSLTPAICPENSLATGLTCTGRYCDDVGLTCSGNYKEIDGTEKWSPYFSEENNDISNAYICENNKFLTGLRCQGSYCDKISMRCSLFEGLSQQSCSWSEWFSEEEEELKLPVGHYIAGIECEGSYCDSKRVYSCRSPEVWTEYNSEEQGSLPHSICPAGMLAEGFACSGRYCDNIALRCRSETNVSLNYEDASWNSYFSEEKDNEAICPQSQAITAVKCEGRYCDNIAIQCTRIETASFENCHWSRSFSEEEGGRLDLPLGYVAQGMRCSGRYCDNKQIYACQIK